MKKKALAMVLSAMMALSLAGCGGDGGDQKSSQPSDSSQPSTEESKSEESSSDAGEAGNEVSGEPVVIRYGTHWINDLDPYHTDDVSGDYTMEESRRQASIKALEAIKEAYNVEFEFLQ